MSIEILSQCCLEHIGPNFDNKSMRLYIGIVLIIADDISCETCYILRLYRVYFGLSF